MTIYNRHDFMYMHAEENRHHEYNKVKTVKNINSTIPMKKNNEQAINTLENTLYSMMVSF